MVSVGPAVHPRQQAEGEHVLGPGGVLAGEAELLDRLDGHPGQVDGVHGELAQLEPASPSAPSGLAS